MNAVEDILASGIIARDNYVICTTIVGTESMSYFELQTGTYVVCCCFRSIYILYIPVVIQVNILYVCT